MFPAAPDMNEKNDDDIYDRIGQIGPYQVFILILIAFTATAASSAAYSIVFVGAKPDFRCKLPAYENDTFDIQSEDHKFLVDTFIPKDKDGSLKTCELKAFNYSSPNLISNTSEFTLVKCSEYVFSRQYYSETIVTSWKLVCDRETIKSTIDSIFFFGYFGEMAVGLLGDRFGRKIVTYAFLFMNAVATILIAVLTNISTISISTQIVLFTTLRLIVGIATNIYIIGIVLGIELVGPKWRVTASNSFYYSYILGEFITLVFGLVFTDYRAFNICLAVFMSSFLLYFWIVPESPRFLMVKGRRKEAANVLKTIARSNNKEFTDDMIDVIERPSSSKINSVCPQEVNEKLAMKNEKSFIQKLWMALKSGKFRTRLLVNMLNWFSNTLVYYGLSFNIGALGGNPYLNFTYAAVVELAGITASHLALEKIGRKIPYTVGLMLAGLSLVSISFVPKDLSTLNTCLALLGKFFISFTYNAVFVVTAETYPTEIRNTAISFCSAQSRIGGVIAPYIQLLGSIYWFPLPFLIYGASALLASITYIIFIPETKHARLVDKLDEMLD